MSGTYLTFSLASPGAGAAEPAGDIRPLGRREGAAKSLGAGQTLPEIPTLPLKCCGASGNKPSLSNLIL